MPSEKHFSDGILSIQSKSVFQLCQLSLHFCHFVFQFRQIGFVFFHQMRGGFFGVAGFGEFGVEFVQGFLQLLGFFAQTGGFGGFVDFDFQHQARAVADGDGRVFAFGQGGDLPCFGQAGHHRQVFEVVRQVVRAFDKQRSFDVRLDAHFAAQVADGADQILQHGHLLECRLNNLAAVGFGEAGEHDAVGGFGVAHGGDGLPQFFGDERDNRMQQAQSGFEYAQ